MPAGPDGTLLPAGGRPGNNVPGTSVAGKSVCRTVDVMAGPFDIPAHSVDSVAATGAADEPECGGDEDQNEALW